MTPTQDGGFALVSSQYLGGFDYRLVFWRTNNNGLACIGDPLTITKYNMTVLQISFSTSSYQVSLSTSSISLTGSPLSPNYTRVCESTSIKEGKTGEIDRIFLRLFFTDELKMAFPDAGERPLSIALYNQQGQKVFHKNYPETPSILTVNDHRIAMLPAGIYFLKIVKGDEEFPMKKLVKLK